MVILSKNGAQHRTQLMSHAHADQFAACLRANPLFSGVVVYESPRAKHPERRWYVVYHAASEEAQQRLLQSEEDKRTARAEAELDQYLIVLDEGRRFYWVQSASGEVYEVTRFDCSCPDYEFRCRQAGIRCKHQLAVEAATEQGGGDVP